MKRVKRITEEQRDLLCAMVEADRRVQREERQPFVYLKTAGGANLLHHRGFPEGDYATNDREVQGLRSEGFLTRVNPGASSPNYVLRNEALVAYQAIKEAEGEPVEATEDEVHRFIEAGRLAERYPEAHSKWKSAAKVLWSPEAEDHLTKIGHDCREAMQAFATALVDEFKPDDVDTDPKKTKSRVRAVLLSLQQEDDIGKTKRRYLEGLLGWWDKLNDLVQRQEHGAQREGEGVTWEDGRAVVFGTGLAMYEIDRTIR